MTEDSVAGVKRPRLPPGCSILIGHSEHDQKSEKYASAAFVLATLCCWGG
ncbi:hypothetical protein Plim_2573 [Planctopirus limnophila DSM 3776]|uniref:Uncharacterized protein n=1 Tax=Planctopirus limnophila (strain ATCC 43296 / DSM 3776 / IFAM 1008 / Mu 290) TaxID=521674 RepID=D5SQ23_PLAL2|nr:hypothetical protein Plim_2573 [Planctopirus limnophila DSM 3776]